ncbi:hypothetical protein BABINDRAFT_178621 [Babjeviella inositovora NRRL Y-12698]|uniref:Riboflavin kinase n=1 Tax=Babjeviella inositovora NRRL Y-12698 TaxID=984486 RepID=A0A1E3QX46_9ASCO|nr:uncharacterized protein BABINDRAFT_178621 [Babjeviella inositovora NRRL Y-12698]ODQ82253.1 hypothetical protein BABINDRAFT_178621 [Babjeviella inositovora NRRL Y-12698]
MSTVTRAPRVEDAPIPQSPVSPYPITEEAEVVAGFGRGSAELGIPTANLPIDQLPLLNAQIDRTGVYFGWCVLRAHPKEAEAQIKTRSDGKTEVEYNFGNQLSSDGASGIILPMVASIGWNPFYNNKEKAVELHVMHKFDHSFYGAVIRFNILGYIRPELNYTTKEALIKDIHTDIEIALETLATPEYTAMQRTLLD